MQDRTESENTSPINYKSSRRQFLSQVAVAGTGMAMTPLLKSNTVTESQRLLNSSEAELVTVTIIINRKKRILHIDSRVTLLDALRENLALTGTKKGCDRGQCGACSILLNGRRVNSCLTLAAMCNNKEVTTIEGLAVGEKLHPMQEAFIKHDAFQCGYCTPGQICSAIGMLKEGHAITDTEIQELMSGNICRCGAYRNIVNAIKEVKAG